MFEKILFPTDFSEEAKTELNCITGIPEIREIIILHVIKRSVVPGGASMVESLAVHTAEVYLQKAKTYIALLNPEILVRLDETTSSDITGAILEKAEEHEVDLIVIHATMKSIMAGLLLGSVHSQILCRDSKINVMVMPDKLVKTLSKKTFEKFCPMIFSRILCPTNFSELSLKAAALASSLKGVGEIILLHVVERGGAGADPGEAVRRAETRLKTLCINLATHGIKTRAVVVTGKPKNVIPQIAQAEDASLIWMRSAAKGCLHDFFFGSMVHDVVMNASQPVIVIRSYQ